MRPTLLTATFLAAAALMPFAPAAGAADRRVEVVNASGRTMMEFYASNTNRSSWEEDILGNDVLPSGRSVVINIDDGSGACRFDVLAVLDGGRRVEQRNINVCEVSRHTVR
ncbi:hypothetical protein IBL26_08360 [Roseomonas aerophila]|uniref:Uncharacterized protein n=1 Tax=Teichococcus aerophilus TaxID=1224513 RepID=A0ABR7RKK3_9PROT|nr:hypothetical protein [Pseudoroseomonas aerophila]MBC9206846.1 hypothetical protein [Pseudoroseomonas aerophila]